MSDATDVVAAGGVSRWRAVALERGSRRSRAAGGLPWRAGDLANVGSGLLIGALGLLIGWVGASGTTGWNDQLLWIAVAAGGVIAAGVLIAGWLLAGFRAVRERQRLLTEELESRLVPRDRTVPATAEPDAFVTAENMTRYHRPGCPLMGGKTSRRRRRKGADASLRACGVCRP